MYEYDIILRIYSFPPISANGIKSSFVLVQISRYQQIIGVFTLQCSNDATKVSKCHLQWTIATVLMYKKDPTLKIVNAWWWNFYVHVKEI